MAESVWIENPYVKITWKKSSFEHFNKDKNHMWVFEETREVCLHHWGFPLLSYPDVLKNEACYTNKSFS